MFGIVRSLPSLSLILSVFSKSRSVGASAGHTVTAAVPSRSSAGTLPPATAI